MDDQSVKLFLSADLIGSTEIKASANKSEDKHNEVAASWVNLFSEFYSSILTTYNDYLEEYGLPHAELWKALGDEIILKIEIVNPINARKYLISFCKAVTHVESRLSENGKQRKFKLTGWLAGFPVINREVDVGSYKDYLGPTIDTGFRLKQFSAYNKFVLSLELVYLLSITEASATGDEKIRLYLEGEYVLKGVFSGRAYPIFYLLPITNDSTILRQKIIGALKVESEDISNYVKYFINEIDNDFLICLPYFKGFEGDVFPSMPERHRTHHRFLEAQQASLAYMQSDSTEKSGDDIGEKKIDAIYDSIQFIK